MGIGIGAEHSGQGWHSGATVTVFSAAAGAAHGLGLSVGQTIPALGIAATQSAGLMATRYGAMVKRKHAGRSPQSGLYRALLAAPPQCFEGVHQQANLERLLHFIAILTLATEHLSLTAGGTICYCRKVPHPDGTTHVHAGLRPEFGRRVLIHSFFHNHLEFIRKWIATYKPIS